MDSLNLNTWGAARAKENDRQYFVGHFGRRFRVRDMMPFEFDGPVERAFGIPRRVIVAQIVPGVRKRVLVQSVLFDREGAVADYDDNDVSLQFAFEDNASAAEMVEYRATCAKHGVSL